jgi:hypothetical protein
MAVPPSPVAAEDDIPPEKPFEVSEYVSTVVAAELPIGGTHVIWHAHPPPLVQFTMFGVVQLSTAIPASGVGTVGGHPDMNVPLLAQSGPPLVTVE